jgi:hypothetical protein
MPGGSVAYWVLKNINKYVYLYIFIYINILFILYNIIFIHIIFIYDKVFYNMHCILLQNIQMNYENTLILF